MKNLYTSSLPIPKYRTQCPLRIILKRIAILGEVTDHGTLFFSLKLPLDSLHLSSIPCISPYTMQGF
jgi:hypothetical protein